MVRWDISNFISDRKKINTLVSWFQPPPGTPTSFKFTRQTSIPQCKIGCTKLLQGVFVLFLSLITVLENKNPKQWFLSYIIGKILQQWFVKISHQGCQGQRDPSNRLGGAYLNTKYSANSLWPFKRLHLAPSFNTCCYLALHPLPSTTPHHHPGRQHPKGASSGTQGHFKETAVVTFHFRFIKKKYSNA